MRLTTGNQLYEGFEQIMESTHECPVDTEYSLPDYCADIQKILKCIVTPEVVSAAVIGDSLSVDGAADIRVLYLDAKGECVRGFDTKKEFSFNVRLNGSTEGAAAVVRPFVQHMTCRAMNARRVDMHITLGFNISVTAVRRTELAERIESDLVETHCDTYAASRAVGCCMHTFILEENIELQNGKPPIETVLRRGVRYQIDSVQLSDGAATITGRACVEILYRTFSDTALPERMACELPFTQTVECAGVDETCTASVCCPSGECTIQPREDSVGEYMILNLYLKPTFCVKFTKPCTVCAVSDAFSIRGALEAKYKNASLERCEQLPARQIKVSDTIRIPDGDLERVVDLWCDGLSLSAFTEKESAAVRGKFSVCVLYQTKEKRMAFLERMLDFTDSHESPGDGRLSASGEITAVRFTITDAGALECTAELSVAEQVRCVYPVRAVESAELDETAACDACCAAVYYAACGERIWDIAKRYKARVSAIQAHNNCTGDTLTEDRPMIICRK